MTRRGWSMPSGPWQDLSKCSTLSDAIPIAWPSLTTGSPMSTRSGALYLPQPTPGESPRDHDPASTHVHPPLSPACLAPGLAAPAPYRLFGQPLQGAGSTAVPTTAQPTCTTHPAEKDPSRVDVAVDRDRRHPMSALWPWAIATSPFGHPATERRATSSAAGLGCVMSHEALSSTTMRVHSRWVHSVTRRLRCEIYAAWFRRCR